LREYEPAGTSDTAGFVLYRVIFGSVTTHTRHGYGVTNPDPWYTRIKPYLYCSVVGIHRLILVAWVSLFARVLLLF